MTVVTIPAEYNNWVITPSKKIKKNPSRVYVFLEYDDEKSKFSKLNDSKDINISELKADLLNTKTYWKWYKDTDNFMKDLFD